MTSCVEVVILIDLLNVFVLSMELLPHSVRDDQLTVDKHVIKDSGILIDPNWFRKSTNRLRTMIGVGYWGYVTIAAGTSTQINQRVDRRSEQRGES